MASKFSLLFLKHREDIHPAHRNPTLSPPNRAGLPPMRSTFHIAAMFCTIASKAAMILPFFCKVDNKPLVTEKKVLSRNFLNPVDDLYSSSCHPGVHPSSVKTFTHCEDKFLSSFPLHGGSAPNAHSLEPLLPYSPGTGSNPCEICRMQNMPRPFSGGLPGCLKFGAGRA